MFTTEENIKLMCLIGVHKNTLIVMLLILLLVSSSCGKEQPPVMEVAEDPCAPQNLTTNFTMGGRIGVIDNYAISDYAFTGNYIKFEANKKCFDEYEFKVGANTYSQDCVLVYFNEFDTVKNEPIRLVTQKNDVLCEEYLGSDTVTRYLNTYHICDWPMLGTYSGFEVDQPDTNYQVFIGNYEDSVTGNCRSFTVNNINNSGCIGGLGFFGNYTFLDGVFSSSCQGINGRYKYYPETSKIELRYVYTISINPFERSDTITYIAYKIQ